MAEGRETGRSDKEPGQRDEEPGLDERGTWTTDDLNGGSAMDLDGNDEGP